MKKLFISVALSSALFAGNTSCDKVLQKLDSQITKVKNHKKQNPLKLEYLETEKNEVSKNCVDGKIDTNTLKQIQSKAKYDYENKKLEQDKQKLNEKQGKLADKKEKLDKKYKEKSEKLNEKKDKKSEKNIKKEGKKAEKNLKEKAKKQDK